MHNLDMNFMRDPQRQNYAKEFLRELKPRQKLRRVFNASQQALGIVVAQTVQIGKKAVYTASTITLVGAISGSVANLVRADVPTALVLSSSGTIAYQVNQRLKG